MREMVKTTIPLFVICFFVALCLAFVNSCTKATIVERNNENAQEQRKQVMSEAKSFTEISGWEDKDQSGIIKEAYAGYDGEKLVGYVFSAYPKGYGGEIKVTVGVGFDKKILGVRIGDNKETPGLGAKASEEVFYGQYAQKDIEKPFRVVKGTPTDENEIQAISGATISSNAVTNAVSACADLAAMLFKDGGDSK